MSKEHDRKEKLIEAYNLMMQHVSEALSKATDETRPRLRQAIEKAEEKLEELGELTREEIDKVSEYLRRDLQQAADYLAGDEARELKEWLRIDLDLIEGQLLELLFSAADQAKLDMLRFEEELIEAREYRTGEITGPGVLVCEQCGEELHFHKTGHIPPCPKCHGTVFMRQ